MNHVKQKHDTVVNHSEVKAEKQDDELEHEEEDDDEEEEEEMQDEKRISREQNISTDSRNNIPNTSNDGKQINAKQEVINHESTATDAKIENQPILTNGKEEQDITLDNTINESVHKLEGDIKTQILTEKENTDSHEQKSETKEKVNQDMKDSLEKNENQNQVISSHEVFTESQPISDNGISQKNGEQMETLEHKATETKADSQMMDTNPAKPYNIPLPIADGREKEKNSKLLQENFIKGM